MSDTPTNDLRATLQCIILGYLRSHVDESLSDLDSDESLLALGLDSVGAAAIAVEIEKTTGVRMSPDLLYEMPTVRMLVDYLARQRPSAPAPVPAPAAPPKPRGRGRDEFYRSLRLRTQRFDAWKVEGRYFFDTPFSDHGERQSKVAGRPTLMLASFAYLGLVGHPAVNAGATTAVKRFGAGCHGVPMVAGKTDIHRALEQRLAAFVGAAGAILFPSGFATNVATLQALVGPCDRVLGDELNHASLVDGCTISGAAFNTFRHNDTGHLESLLREPAGGTTLVVVDGVYSMEGDIAPLPAIVELCRRYDARLMVDEAHSFGVLGRTGRGVAEHFGLPPDAIDVTMGNLSKALGSQGGFIAGNLDLIDYLRHHARGYIFSTGLGPPLIGAALAALDILEREPERVARLRANARRLVDGLRALGFRVSPTESAIVPLLCDTEDQALAMTGFCRDAGVFVVPILYPAVPMNAPRLRLNVMATHTDAEIEFALDVLARAGRAAGLLNGVTGDKVACSEHS